ncbi:hypothetical protein E2K98_18345 [Bacillus salipaludis]|uniref:IclR-ED domain-containing protein n=1 Tax=Bacillus salipaludis TaxID=2547811 RepID=A0A4R5VNM5_9BACI|nr:hypothetical protein E2K98_18345 [Bacillus salipaludis]
METKSRFLLSHSELENYISAVAAPIFNYNGSIIAGISIAGLDVNYQKEMLPSLVEKVRVRHTRFHKSLDTLNK